MTTNTLKRIISSSIIAACVGACHGGSGNDDSALGGSHSNASPGGGGFGGGSGGSGGACGGGGAFANAICLCDGFAHAGQLVTHAPPGGAASVGVNGRSAVANGTFVDGAWTAYGGLGLSGDVSVRDDLVSAQDIDGGGTLHVGHDLDVGAGLRMSGTVTVGGTLRAAGVTATSGQVSAAAYGSYVAPAGPPCPCDPGSFIDVAAAVAQARAQNDNATHGMPSSIASSGTMSLTFPSGDYYFENVASGGTLAWRISGHVRIFIDGALATVGDDAISLDPGATLDLYVSGNIAQAGRVQLGAGGQPSDFRLYLGGDHATLAASGNQAWTGLIYAPTATIAFGGSAVLDGALFANRLDYSGDFTVNYSAPASGGGNCNPDGGTGGGSVDGGSGGGAGSGGGNPGNPDGGTGSGPIQ